VCYDGEWQGVCFSGISPSGDQGFPGNVNVEVFYMLNDNNEILMRYLAHTDEDTPISLTNHTYFNLAGHKAGSIAGHIFQIHDNVGMLEIDGDFLPTGRVVSTADTVFDFSKPRVFTGEMDFDHCFCWSGAVEKFDGEKLLPLRVTVTEPESGRKMTVRSNQRCCQFYTGNMLVPTDGKDGFVYDKHGAFCLETAAYSDAPNVVSFPSAILHPGEVYDSATIYAFSKM
jgi:aldose 1-epimerase